MKSVLLFTTLATANQIRGRNPFESETNRNLILINPPINSEGTCKSTSVWSDWKATSDCCSGPVKKRRYFKRTCINLSCKCLGASDAYQLCPENSCPETPGFCYWTGWSEWEETSGCTEMAFRSCQTNRQDPTCCAGGTSKSRQRASCTVPRVTQWAQWGAWSSCINQSQTRSAGCLNTNCAKEEMLTERRTCANRPFVIWGAWGSWSSCVASKRQRTRPCMANDANYCQGPLTATEVCESSTTKADESGFCTVGNKFSLNWCLRFNWGCGNWYRNDFAMHAVTCMQAQFWNFDSTTKRKFYQVFAGFIY